MVQILYVEDSKDTAEAVKIMLEGEGYEVELAFTGKDGLDKLLKGNYKLVLLDIMLPDMSGWDIFESVSKSEKGKKMKYAFLSAIPVSSDRMEELKKSGVSDYITKPFSKDDLISRVKKMLD